MASQVSCHPAGRSLELPVLVPLAIKEAERLGRLALHVKCFCSFSSLRGPHRRDAWVSKPPFILPSSSRSVCLGLTQKPTPLSPSRLSIFSPSGHPLKFHPSSSVCMPLLPQLWRHLSGRTSTSGASSDQDLRPVAMHPPAPVSLLVQWAPLSWVFQGLLRDVKDD